MKDRIDTPYGPKTPELLVRAMDALESPLYRAAPELLEALRVLATARPYEHGQCGRCGMTAGGADLCDSEQWITLCCTCAQEDARAAIAKATVQAKSGPACTCHLKAEVSGPVPHCCPAHDGDYMTFLAMNNCD